MTCFAVALENCEGKEEEASIGIVSSYHFTSSRCFRDINGLDVSSVLSCIHIMISTSSQYRLRHAPEI